MKKTKLIALVLAAVMAVALFSGCGSTANIAEADVPEAAGVAGRVIVSINPEVAVDYDAAGTVVNVEGLNEDGVYVATQYGENYEGKETRVVVSELVDLIYQDGYFATTVNGNEKNIVVKVEQGSELPSDDFVEVIAGDVHVVVSEHNGGSVVVTVGLGDYSFEYSEEGYISLGKAEEIALAQGAAADGSVILEKEYAVENGQYAIEYLTGDMLNVFNVDAITGKVTGFVQEYILDVINGGFVNHAGLDDQIEAYWEAYGNSWENWGEAQGNYWEAYGEAQGDQWEAYGEGWEAWGESVGDYFDRNFDF